MESLDVLFFGQCLGKPGWAWLGFLTVVLLLLALDLGVLHRERREIPAGQSLLLSAGFASLGILFGGWVWWYFGSQAGMEYLTGFAIEKALALDNVFVIVIIFAFFNIPRANQHRVLFWGILGVIVLRAVMIALGSAIVGQFSWVLYVFSLILILTGFKMLLVDKPKANVGSNPLLLWMQRRFNVAKRHDGEQFFVKHRDPATGTQIWFVTPLFLALVLIEVADLIFAVDSIPAIFAITSDPFVIYTSNVFAILGLRPLYFALADIVQRFRYLKFALALVLVFIGSKIFVADLIGVDKFPPVVALVVTFGILILGVLFSLIRSQRDKTDTSIQDIRSH